MNYNRENLRFKSEIKDFINYIKSRKGSEKLISLKQELLPLEGSGISKYIILGDRKYYLSLYFLNNININISEDVNITISPYYMINIDLNLRPINDFKIPVLLKVNSVKDNNTKLIDNIFIRGSYLQRSIRTYDGEFNIDMIKDILKINEIVV